MPVILKAEHVTFYYNKGLPQQTAAVQDVSLEIQQGELVGVIGHTGSGKSTLVQHFNGLLQPDQGTIYLNGEDIWKNPKEIRKVRFRVGLVFQYPEYQLFGETVYQDIAFGPKNMGLSEKEIDQRVREAARFVQLEPELLEKSPFDLSGGQKRRCAIAGVIAMNPEVLILDEPAAGLDPRGREQILGQLLRYHEQVKNTVLLVSHSMEDVARYADRVLVMNQAKIFCYDTVQQVFSQAEELEKIGVPTESINKILDFIEIDGTTDEKLKKLEDLKIENEAFKTGLEELTEVVKYVRLFGIPDNNFKVDLTIARGLDYYTGTVYETFLNEYRELGSVCSGGRYENLAEHYTDKKLPGVGISIGLTRLFYKLNELNLIKADKKSIAEVLVVPMVDDMTVPIKLVSDLRKNGINTEIFLNDKKLKAKMKYADKLEIPYVIVVGEDEVNSGVVKVKNMKTGEQIESSIEDVYKVF